MTTEFRTTSRLVRWRSDGRSNPPHHDEILLSARTKDGTAIESPSNADQTASNAPSSPSRRLKPTRALKKESKIGKNCEKRTRQPSVDSTPISTVQSMALCILSEAGLPVIGRNVFFLLHIAVLTSTALNITGKLRPNAPRLRRSAVSKAATLMRTAQPASQGRSSPSSQRWWSFDSLSLSF